MCICMYLCMYVLMYGCMHACMHVCMHCVSMYICMSVCPSVCLCMRAYVRACDGCVEVSVYLFTNQFGFQSNDEPLAMFSAINYDVPALSRGQYHGGRRPSSDDSFHSPVVIPLPTLDKPSIMKRYHRRRTTRWGVAARSPTMVTLHDTRFVECRWWNDGWTVKTVVTWRSSASMIPAPGCVIARLATRLARPFSCLCMFRVLFCVFHALF